MAEMTAKWAVMPIFLRPSPLASPRVSIIMIGSFRVIEESYDEEPFRREADGQNSLRQPLLEDGRFQIRS